MTEPRPPISMPAAAPPSSTPHPAIDWVLEELVDVVNRSTVEVPVTLVVQGAVVTGKLIGHHKFYEEYGKVWYQALTGSSKGGSEAAESVRDRWTKEAKEALEYMKTTKEYRPPTYVHLKDAKYVLGPGLPIPSGTGSLLWRGRISEVAAFSLGELGPGS